VELTAPALVPRARIILGCASSLQNKELALQVGADPVTVSKWRRRSLADGFENRRSNST
jgi:hypothetical protein